MRFNKSIAAVFAVAAMVPSLAMAKTSSAKMSSKMGSKSTVPATVKCPKCGMAMAKVKSAGAPVRVTVKHHYYYCCKECGYKGDTASKSSSKMGGKMSSKMGGKMSGKM